MRGKLGLSTRLTAAEMQLPGGSYVDRGSPGHRIRIRILSRHLSPVTLCSLESVILIVSLSYCCLGAGERQVSN